MTKDLNIENLELHPYCALFPQADNDTFAGLVADIKQNGLRDPIVKYQGKILDGRNRYLACLEAKVEPHFVEYDEEKHGDPLAYVLSKNATRRHLSESQRAMVADGLTNPQIYVSPLTQKKAAAMMGISERQVQYAAKLRKDASVELIECVFNGTTNIHAALKEIKPSKPVERIDTFSTKQPESQNDPNAHTPTPPTTDAKSQDESVANPPAPEPPTNEQPKYPKLNPSGNAIADEFDVKMLSGMFHHKYLKKKYTEFEKKIEAMNEVPDLLTEIFDLSEHPHQGNELCERLDVLSESCAVIDRMVQAMRIKLQRRFSDTTEMVIANTAPLHNNSEIIATTSNNSEEGVTSESIMQEKARREAEIVSEAIMNVLASLPDKPVPPKDDKPKYDKTAF